MASTIRKLAEALGVEPLVLLGDALNPREREVPGLSGPGSSR